MGEQWHLVRSGRQSGPHSLEELQRLLAGVDVDQEQVLVWTERLKEWSDPRKVPGVFAPPAAVLAEAPASAGFPVRTGGAMVDADLSSLNPYQTPVSSLARPSAPVAAGELGNHELEVGACIQAGWKLTLRHFWKLVLFGIAYVGIFLGFFFLLGMVLGAVGLISRQETSTTGTLANFVLQLVQWVVSTFLGIGASLFGLGMLRQANPSIGVLFGGGPHFWPVFAASFLVYAAVFAGILLLIIPGIYVAVRLSQFQFAIIDGNLGPLEGIKASWAMTRGNFWNLILLGLAGMGICILGFLALGIGVLWAYPTILLAGVASYLCMSRGAGALPRFE